MKVILGILILFTMVSGWRWRVRRKDVWLALRLRCDQEGLSEFDRINRIEEWHYVAIIVMLALL